MILGKLVTSLDDREFVQLLEECSYRLRSVDRRPESEAVMAVAHRFERDWIAAMPVLDDIELGLVKQRELIKAIKAYRERTGSGLWAAKTIVDRERVK
jgi:ribosomal protein L7/L12